MDMEVIQEFSENQCYLNALAQLNRQKPLELKLIEPKEQDILLLRPTETLELVLKEPIGKLMFRHYLTQVQSQENLFFFDVFDEYQHFPLSAYRAKIAKRIIKDFIKENARQQLPLPALVRETVQQQFDAHGAIDNLFDSVYEHVLLNLSLSTFPSFLLSRYYRRLCAYRLTEKRVMTKDEFTFIRILGEGGFGKVFAVSKNDTRALYACKAMSKDKIAAKKREKLIMNERNILTQVSHPFIVNLKYAFQDEQQLYLVQDLMSGGELAFHLQRHGFFSEETVAFYAAGIVLAIEHFHSLNIVYRDLKPENIMLDADGYIRVTDLGLCAQMNVGQLLYQHCGTRSYMAPEQCYGDEGYDKGVDWWSLGITIFHMLTGKNPFSSRYRRKQPRPEQSPPKVKDTKSTRTFGGFGWKSDKDAENDEKNQQEIKESNEQKRLRYEQLKNMYQDCVKNLPWPADISKAAKSICKKLICIDATKRLGTNGADEVKRHPFFAHISWTKLMARHMSAPIVPDREYVNAKFLESAASALPPSNSKDVCPYFEGFDYTRNLVFQEEIMSTIHDKSELIE